MAEIDWAIPDRPIELRPIRSISFSNQAPAAGCQKLYADGKFAELLAQVEVCLPKDAAGDFIAKEERFRRGALSPGPPGGEYAGDEQAKASQEIRDVLGWLMGYVGAKVEDLTPKTKLQSYCEHDYEGFLAVLKKNRKKLAIDPARRASWLRAEFEGSVGEPLHFRERADEWIDSCAAVRADGRGDRDCGKDVQVEGICQSNIKWIILASKCISRSKFDLLRVDTIFPFNL